MKNNEKRKQRRVVCKLTKRSNDILLNTRTGGGS